MHRAVRCLTVATLGACALRPASAQAGGANADSAARPALDAIIARSLGARGWLAALRAVRTERLTGSITFPSGDSGPDTVELARPLRVRTTIHLGAGVVLQGYDGRTAWALNTLAGDTAAHPLDPGTAANVIAGADMDGPFVDYATKGIAVTLAGRDTANGRPAWSLHVVRPDGSDDTYFVDTATALVTKWRGRRTLGGTAVVFETDFSDYRPVGGVRLPFRLASRTVGRPGVLLIAIDSAAVNVPIADDRFTMPDQGAR